MANRLHKHNWERREVVDSHGRTIWGYQCTVKSCLKRDYVDMSSGRPSKAKT